MYPPERGCMKTIRFAVCGCGCRGTWLTENVVSKLPDVTVVGLCDTYEDKAASLSARLDKNGKGKPPVFTDHNEMFDAVKPDAVLVATSWTAHVPVSMDAMRRGIATAMEVGGAYTEKECRDLIRCYEETKTPFMLMENCCYNRDELLATALVRNGLFGDIVYCHGCYAHDLREEVAKGDINRHYRLHEYSTHNCDNYPTHELGPIARLLNITRGNRMCSLTSRSSKALGLHAYVQDKPELAYLKDRAFTQGDIVETLITCEGGELISLRLDTTLPRYYSREFTVRGTKGMYNQDNDMVMLDNTGFEEFFDTWKTYAINNHNAQNYAEYLPDIWKHADPKALAAGHGGMDWFEFEAFVGCLREGKPMPIDVYDAAAWMSITYLTEQSIKANGAPVEIPDFTDGAYKTRTPEDVLPLPHIEKN